MRIFVILMLGVGAAFAADLPVPAPGNVTLPLDEYNQLLELAARPAKAPDAPPVPHVVKSALFNLDVAGESVAGTVQLDGEVLAGGIHPVPLLSGMIVMDAQNQSAALPVEQRNGMLTALIGGPGDFAVSLKSVVPLTIETGRASFSLPVPAAGVARLTLSVPGEQTAVNLSSGLITGRSSSAGRTIIEATLVPGQTVSVWWAARMAAPPQQPKEVRFLSDVKTLTTVGESDLTIAALVEVTVLQGESGQFTLRAPDGWELTTATGPTLAGQEVKGKDVILRVAHAAARNHQFLISFARSEAGNRTEIPLVTFPAAQRETGEVLVESEGTLELAANGRGGLRRMDLKETSSYLRSLSRASLHDAFHYQKRATEPPVLALAWTRFPDSKVLSAVAQRAEVTTLVTAEGRSLSEVKLTLTNRSQPFLKIGLPAGAAILSADVAGEKVKPVTAADGGRIPLLRAGFRPSAAYVVSFMFQHAGVPFGKKGGADLQLPQMDIPIGLVEWEVFLPSQFSVKDFGGDLVPARMLPQTLDALDEVRAGALAGIVTDASGAVIPGASIQVMHMGTRVAQNVVADSEGRWSVAGMPPGRVRVAVNAPGFQSTLREFDHRADAGTPVGVTLQVGSVREMVEVAADVAAVRRESQQGRQQAKQKDGPQNAQEASASSNVIDLQKKVAGVLPIAMNLPRAGTAYRFARPLVMNEATRLTFVYRNR